MFVATISVTPPTNTPLMDIFFMISLIVSLHRADAQNQALPCRAALCSPPA